MQERYQLLSYAVNTKSMEANGYRSQRISERNLITTYGINNQLVDKLLHRIMRADTL